MTNIALISDLHFGVKSSSEKFLNIQINFFNNLLIPTLKNENVEYLFILGDFFDNPLTTNNLIKDTTINLINNIIKNLPDIKIIIQKGNHDIYFKNTLEVASINFLKQFPNIEVISNIKEFVIDNKTILSVPWLIKDTYTHNEFVKIIESNKKYDFCFGHFEINQFEIIPSVIETKGFNIEDFSNFTEVYSGHFHIRNKIKNIQYLGCPYEITWNDFGSPKGITLLNLKDNTSKFIENTISPKHLKINLSSVVKDKTILKSFKNNFIKFFHDVSLKPDKKLDLEDTLVKLGALELDIIDNTYTIEEDDENIDVKEDVQGSPLKFLFNFFDEIKHPDEINITELKLLNEKLYNDALKD